MYGCMEFGVTIGASNSSKEPCGVVPVLELLGHLYRFEFKRTFVGDICLYRSLCTRILA